MLHAEMHRIGRKHIGQGAGCGEKRRNRLPLIRRRSERTPSAAVQVESDEGQTGQIHPDKDQRRIEPDHTVFGNQDRKETKRFAQAVMMEGGQDVPAVAKAETESGNGEVTLENVFEEAVVPVAVTVLDNYTNSSSVDFVDMTRTLTIDNAYLLLSNIDF